MALNEKAVLVRTDPELLAQRHRALGGFGAHGQNDQIGGHLDLRAGQSVGSAHDQLVALGIDHGHAAAHILGPIFFHGPAGALVIALSGRAYVHVKDIGLGIRDVILGQNGLLGRVHAAEARTVRPVHGLVARAHALDEDHVLGFLAVGRTLDVPAGGTGGREQALVLHAGDDIRVAALAVLRILVPVEEVITRGHDDRAHVHVDQLVLLLEIDALDRTDLGAQSALALLEHDAGFRVDGRLLGDGLRKGDIDGRGVAEAFIELVGEFAAGAFFHAQTAARAVLPVHVGRLLADHDLEIAHIPAHRLDLGRGIKSDFRVLGNVDHLGAQNAGRAVHRGEGLVQLGHLAADGLLALDHDDFLTAVGAVQRRLDAGHAATDDQHALDRLEALGHERTVATQFLHGHAHQFGRLARVQVLGLADPGDMLADVGHFKHVAVQPRAFHGPAEGRLVHARGAGGHDHAVEILFLDGLDDGVLTGFGAGVHRVRGVHHVGVGQGRGRD